MKTQVQRWREQADKLREEADGSPVRNDLMAAAKALDNAATRTADRLDDEYRRLYGNAAS